MEDDIAHRILHDRENGAALLLSEYKSGLYSVALTLCRDTSEAEDLVFRAVERAISKIDTFQNHDSLYSWLCVILVNTYRDSIRKKVVSGTFPVGGAADVESFTEPAGPDSLVSEIDGGFVRQALESMPESMREVLLLHYFMDMSTVKIAKFLALPVGTVKSRLHYARIALGARLGARLKKTGVVLIAASLFLTAVATAIVSALPDADGDQHEYEPIPVLASASGPSAAESDVPAHQEGGIAESDIPGPQELDNERKAKNNTILGRLFRKAARGMSMVAMTMLAANATYGDDPYIEGDGTSGISTGYRMNGNSRIEVDFAIPDVSDTSEWNECRIFGTDNNTYEPTLQTCLYATYTSANGNRFFRLRTKTSASSSQPTKYKSGVDTARHTAVFDLKNAKIVFMTGGVTNSYGYSDGGADKTVNAGVDFSGQVATMPLSLFGRFGNAYGTVFGNRAKARIYGVKIFENGVPVRNFVPCMKDGVACFRDLVGGGFIVGENAAAFSAGGDVQTCADDGYVSTAANADDIGGMLYFDTGYMVSKDTAVALDCALAANYTNSRLWHLFDTASTRFGFNYNKSNGLRYNAFGASSYATTFTTAFPAPTTGKDVRRTFFIDNYKGVAAVVTSGFTNQTATFTTSSAGKNATSMKLATAHDATANGNNWAPLKIYGCKIWEAGVLVRDFIPYVNNGTPGLRDSITGSFIAASRCSSDTTGSTLAYGGVIEGEQDAYLSSNGTTGLDTGYKMNSASRLEVDFSLLAPTDPTAWNQWRIFGSDAVSSELHTCLYLSYNSNNGNEFFALRAKRSDSSNASVKYKPGVDNDRHVAIVDLSGSDGKLVFTTGSTTNSYSGGSTPSTGIDFSNQEATLPLSLFARFSNAAGTAYDYCAKARIYSVRIYESDALVHEFLPYSRDGIAGLYDTVTGEVKSNGSSFTFGGIGQDHGQLKAYVRPGYDDMIDYGETTTLTAYAPGATSYRWLCDGVPIEGGTDGALSVAWMRGGAPRSAGSKVRTYQAVAIFDFYGATRESEPSAPVEVRFRQRGISIIIK